MTVASVISLIKQTFSLIITPIISRNDFFEKKIIFLCYYQIMSYRAAHLCARRELTTQLFNNCFDPRRSRLFFITYTTEDCKCFEHSSRPKDTYAKVNIQFLRRYLCFFVQQNPTFFIQIILHSIGFVFHTNRIAFSRFRFSVLWFGINSFSLCQSSVSNMIKFTQKCKEKLSHILHGTTLIPRSILRDEDEEDFIVQQTSMLRMTL